MRSVILRDPAGIMALVSETGRPELTAPDLNCLSLPTLLAAFRAARECESVRSRITLVASGTWAKYMRVVDHLAKGSPHDPFEAFRRRCRVGDWASRNTRQGARSALTRYAALLVDLHLPVFLRALYRALPDKAERDLLHRAVRRHLLPHAPDGRLPGTYLDTVPDGVLSELARAARFLIETPPDPHGRRLQDTDGRKTGTAEPARRSRSQRSALAAVARLERTRRKTDPGFDWRSALWQQAVRHDSGLDTGMRIMIALLMITGCRPAELVHSGGITILATGAEGEDLLGIGLNGAKVTDLTTLSDPQPALFTSLQVTTLDPERHLKGQPWRKLVLACQTPEACWLHARLRSGLQPVGVPQWDTNGDPSQGRWQLTPRTKPDPLSGKRHPALAGLDKRLARIGKATFPRLQVRITPYLFRHALAAGAKAGGLAREDLARLLGHASTRTGSVYGAASQARTRPCSRAAQILRVEAPLVPRKKHGPGPKQARSREAPRATNRQPQK